MGRDILSEPLVSIIVATYRRIDTLRRALLSLTNQTYSNIEVIVVDDNADEYWNNEAMAIVEQMKPLFINDIIYIKNDKNKGSAETRNIGITRTKGEYITFLDDDDIYLPNKVKNQVEHMQIYESDYSLTDIYLYDEKENLIDKRNRKYIKEYSMNKLLKYHLMYHMTGTDVMMFKKDYLMHIGCFSPINVGDEFYLMQKAIEANGVFSYLPVCDVKAYVHTDVNGLSSGESKVNGENELFNHKKKYISLLSSADKRYINMRHYAVLAFVEIRRKKYFRFILLAIRSLIASPFNFIMLIVRRK